jgi:hypothetical protein
MSTPKQIPTLDDTPKEPRVTPKRCPSCQRPNKPTAEKCSTCGYKLDAPPPPVKPGAATPKKAGGSGSMLVMIPLFVIAAAGGAVAYFGVDQTVAMMPFLGKIPGLAKPPAPVAPPPKAGRGAAKLSAREAQKKATDSMKAEAGTCYTQFNDLMEASTRRGADPNPHTTFQTYLSNGRELANVTSLSAGCGIESKVADEQKDDLCEAARR